MSKVQTRLLEHAQMVKSLGTYIGKHTLASETVDRVPGLIKGFGTGGV